MKFNEFNIQPELIRMLDEMGFEEASPIQSQAIPPAIEGRDLIGQAQTGTGKTAAFGIPMINKINPSLQDIQALVIAPTRELAIQVQEELYRYGKHLKTRVFTVYGGSPIGKQIERLNRYKPEIVVGTPGRILDLINRGVLKVNHIQTLVLDEADEMLNMGFIEDIKMIIGYTNPQRQTMLFSATMPKEIRNLSQQFLTDPVHVQVETQQMTADLIDQYYTKCRDNEKFDFLSRFIDIQNPDQAIIFCRTKKRVDEVGRGLQLRGYNAEMIHGDITQMKRTSVINEFKKGSLELLVATDVAARGLDISGVTHVYNYDISQDPQSYVHRIGRTGRAGKEGMSLTFVTPNEMSYLKTIETLTQIKMSPMQPPTLKEAEVGLVQRIVDQVNLDLENQTVQSHRNTAKKLLDHYDANDLVSALLSQLLTDNTEIEVEISPQRPLPFLKSEGKSSGGRNRNRSRKAGNRREGSYAKGNKSASEEKSTRNNRNRKGNKEYRGKQDSSQRNNGNKGDSSRSFTPKVTRGENMTSHKKRTPRQKNFKIH